MNGASIERLAFAVLVVAGAVGAFVALDAALDRAATAPHDGAALVRTVRVARLEALAGVLVYLAGMAALAAGRMRSRSRGRRNLPASAIMTGRSLSICQMVSIPLTLSCWLNISNALSSTLLTLTFSKSVSDFLANWRI